MFTFRMKNPSIEQNRKNRFSPAKINLCLAVTGRRDDGFHALRSLVVPLDFGDDLSVRWINTDEPDQLQCSDPTLPTDSENLILKAVDQMRLHRSIPGHFEFFLQKYIPVGAGLGGGSSNAVCAIRLINEFLAHPLSFTELKSIAENLGSDCPLFLYDGPCWISGRGEKISPIASIKQGCLGRNVVIFFPGFPVSTAWAYGQLAADANRYYISESLAEQIQCDWEAGSPVPHNSFESIVFQKYFIYNALNDALLAEGLPVLRLSGSGSAAFAMTSSVEQSVAVENVIRRLNGADSWVKITCIALDERDR
jgi:4-diphosphocytidyl-2-C-methyl-D-erythritol kinase